MLTIIIAILLIIGGIGYAVLVLFASMMATTPESPSWREFIGPVIAIALGVGLLVWG